jgi:hypothetical protein
MSGLAPSILSSTISQAVVKNSSSVEKRIGNVQDNGISLFLSKNPDEEVKAYIDLSKMSPGDLPNNPDRINELEKHINDNYKQYTIQPPSKYQSLYVDNSLITEGTINLEEANKLLGCHEIDTQDKSTVTMSEKAMCVSSGGRKSRKQRRSKRRRRRGRQSRK